MKGFASDVLKLLSEYHISMNSYHVVQRSIESEPKPRESSIELRIFGAKVQLKPVTSEEASINVRSVLLGGRGGFPDAALALHGPPGTGKTTTLFKALDNVLERIIENDDILVVYVAPTNQLVREAAYRFLLMYLSRVCRGALNGHVKCLVEALNLIRMYGSKVQAFQSIDEYHLLQKEVKKLGGIGEKLFNALKRINSRVDRNVRFIFTTEWQDFVSKIIESHAKKLVITMFVDEASRSAYYKPFISARSYLQYLIDLLEGRKPQRSLPVLDIRGFVVAGDVMQALVDPEEKGELLLYMLEKRLSEEGYTDRALFLKYTKRLPKGTEEPISNGFYNGVLESVRRCNEIEDILKQLLSSEAERACIKAASQVGCVNPDNICGKIMRLFEELYDNIDRAGGCRIGILMTNVFPSGTMIDEARAKLAAILASMIANVLKDHGYYDILVEAPYTELRDYTKWLLARMHVPGRLNVETVHAVLGGEASIVISMLAKEWHLEGNNQTLYFSQPEVLNVQLSRHRSLLIIIGNVEKLKRSANAVLASHSGKYIAGAGMIFKTAHSLLRDHVVIKTI